MKIELEINFNKFIQYYSTCIDNFLKLNTKILTRCIFSFVFILSILFTVMCMDIARADIVLVADKKQGTLSLVDMDKKKVIQTEPALFGRSHLNELNWSQYNEGKDLGITPSGPFTVNKTYSLQLHENILVFVEGKVAVGAIHPLWIKNPNKNRVNRLMSKTPKDNYVTNGCINVHPDFYYNVLDKLPNETILNILPE